MPISVAEISATIMSLIAGILIFIIAIEILLKWKTKRQNATLFLFFSILAYAGGCLSAMGIYSLAGTALDIAIFLQKMTYTFVLAAGIMMFLFGVQIFFHFKKKLYPILYVLLGIIFIISVLILDSVEWKYNLPGYGNDYPLLSIKLEYSIFLVIYLVPVLVGIAFLAIRASKKLEDRVYAIGYRFIALGNLLILTTFIIDAISTASQGEFIAYAITLNFTWIVPIIAAFCSYIGWTLPDWFRTIIEKK